LHIFHLPVPLHENRDRVHRTHPLGKLERFATRARRAAWYDFSHARVGIDDERVRRVHYAHPMALALVAIHCNTDRHWLSCTPK
jgi:hypothetical protein